MLFPAYLAVRDNNILEAPVAGGSFLHVTTVSQTKQLPALQCLLPTLGALELRKGAAPDPHGLSPVPNEGAIERDDGGGVADEQNAFVLPAVLAFDLGDEGFQHARSAVMALVDILALATRVPNRAPAGVNLAKVLLQLGG